MDDCSKVTMTDVEQFIRFTIRLGGIYETDKDGYVVNKIVDDEDERPVLIKFGSTFKRPMVLKEKITDNDAAVINPLNENVAESQEHKWFYTMLNSGLVLRFIHLFRFIADIVEASAEGKADEMNLTHDVISFISKHKDFDRKAFEHFRLVSKEYTEFMRVWYNRKTKDTRYRCSVYSTDTQVTFPQVTAKSWKAISNIISDVLGLSRNHDLAVSQIEERFFVSSDLLTVPRLESTLTVYSRIYSRINKYLEMVGIDDDDFIVDVTELDYHITRLSEYYKRASWFSSGTFTAPQSKTGIRTIERSGSSIPSSNIPSNPMIGGRPTCIPNVMEDSGSNIPSNPRRFRPAGDIEYANTSFPSNQQGIQYAQPRMQPSFGGPSMGGGFGMSHPSTGIQFGGGMSPIIPQVSGIPINPQLNTTIPIGGGGFSI